MKYLIVVPDGSADDPIDSLGGKTPLEAAALPNIDALAARGEIGFCKTVPDGISPGSDSANLSVMGYDPRVYLTGRSPLEAAAIGVNMQADDIAFRVNFVTVDPAGHDRYEDFIMRDHAAGDIETEDCRVLLDVIAEAFRQENLQFYPGTGYRHCMLINRKHPQGHTDYQCVPPHDILERQIGSYLPQGKDADFLTDMMCRSYELLKEHPINRDREARGLNPANAIWIWGQGVRPSLPNFEEKYGVRGTVISAVDLIKGIGTFAGLETPEIPGATGTIHTDYEAKVRRAIEAYEEGKNFVYMHIEGTDECSHQGNLEAKMRCAEYIDDRVVRPLYAYLKRTGDDFRILIIPDHRTPIAIRTHSSDPVPYVLYDSRHETAPDASKQFNERAAAASGNLCAEGYTMADRFFERKA